MEERLKWKKRHIAGFVTAILVVALWSALLVIYGAEEVAAFIGVERGYLLMFVVAAFGGASTVTSAGFYSTLIALATGGFNPILLGIISGLGLVIGDSMFYYLGWTGGGLFGGRLRQIVDSLAEWLEKQNKLTVSAFVFVYVGCTPLPNDILTVSMGLAGYTYRVLLPGLLLGNIFLSIIVAVMAAGF